MPTLTSPATTLIQVAVSEPSHSSLPDSSDEELPPDQPEIPLFLEAGLIYVCDENMKSLARARRRR